MTNSKLCNLKVIAIDGPAGAGKSTVSRMLAQRLGFVYIDTGAMYRAITYKALKSNVDLTSENDVADLCKKTVIKFITRSGRNIVSVDGEDVTEKIRTPEITKKVFYVADNKLVRKELVDMQRQMALESKSVVLEGRDIGSVVFPNAWKKIYLDAKATERAKRRTEELLQKGMKAEYKVVLEDIENRDKKDFSRAVGGLKKSDDAIYVDTTNLNIEQVVDKLVEIVSK